MTDCVKIPHTAIFTGPTGFGKTRLALDLIEKEYNKRFNYLIINCIFIIGIRQIIIKVTSNIVTILVYQTKRQAVSIGREVAVINIRLRNTIYHQSCHGENL